MTLNAWNTDQLNANGEMLIGSGSNPPTAGTLTGGTNCTIVNGANSAQVTFSGSATGDWVLLSSQSASSASTVEFTSLLSSTYFFYMLLVTAYVPGTDGDRLKMGFSTDNGSTWDTSTTYFRGWTVNGSGTNTFNDADSTGNINIVGSSAVDPGNATNEKSCCAALIFNPTDTQYTRVTSYSSVIDSSGEHGCNTIMSGLESASAINAIRAENDNSDITGEFRLYGMLAS